MAQHRRPAKAWHLARAFAPYLVADEQYQQKRYGMLGQLVNQGRALARYEAVKIINTIKERAARNELNRGLSLSVPYFDDQTLTLELENFEVIPGGRIMFVPAFVVRAATIVGDKSLPVDFSCGLSPQRFAGGACLLHLAWSARAVKPQEAEIFGARDG